MTSGPLWGSLGPLGVARKVTALTYEQRLLANLTGIIAYWPLTPNRWTEGANGILDVSGNGRHGTNSGVTPDAVDGPSAAMGRAPDFIIAQSDYINIFSASLAAAFNPASAFTIALWMRARTTALWTDNIDRNLISLFTSLTQRVEIWKGSSALGNDLVALYNASGNVSRYDASGTSWISLIATFDTANVVLYANNAAQAPDTYTAGAFTITSARIGNIGGTLNYYFDGYLYHVLLLDHVASVAERATIASSS